MLQKPRQIKGIWVVRKIFDSVHLQSPVTSATLARGLPVTRGTVVLWLDVVGIVTVLPYILSLLTTCGISSCDDKAFFSHINMYSNMLMLLSRTHDTCVNPSTRTVTCEDAFRWTQSYATRLSMYVHSEDMLRTWASFLVQVHIEDDARPLTRFVFSRFDGCA